MNRPGAAAQREREREAALRNAGRIGSFTPTSEIVPDVIDELVRRSLEAGTLKVPQPRTA